jgi:uncharacterized membrane protein
MGDYAGNYLSVAGIERKARYHGTPGRDRTARHDQRVRRPDRTARRRAPAVSQPRHLVLDGVPGDWPPLLLSQCATGGHLE